ncbi:MAG: tripartite tricarboxylate transporter substrate binding protein [Proteobacteria bacterium]|nr:tripartite tricarboxylate transporter substrate binding protein [Burkholderiales bacterium]
MIWNRTVQRREATTLATVFFAALLLPAPSWSQGASDFPRRALRMVVPFPPGGSTDIMGRVVSLKLGEQLGQTVVVDNLPGAGGNIGTDVVAKATPDGHTLLMVAVSTLAISASLYSKLPYDVQKDLEPVGLVGSIPFVLLVNAALPAQSVKELIALARSKPGQLNYGSAGAGTTAHMTGELFRSLAGINVVHVAYKGNAPAMVDLIGGQTQFMFDFMPSAMPHIKGGRIRALAVTPTRRSAALPDVPTLAEAGVPGYDVDSYLGVMAPARTPVAIVARINGELNRIAALPDMKERYAREGVEPVSGTPERFRTYLQSEIVKWAKVVKDSGARAD